MEESAGGGADLVAPLRVPLHAEDEVGAARSLPAFDGLDDRVLRAAGGDAKAVAGDSDGLVVAGVDGEPEKAVLLRRLGRGNDGGEQRVGRDGGGVRDGHAAPGAVIDRHRRKMLDQRTTAPDVERLRAEADGEDGLVQVVGVLEEKLVDVLAGGVGGVRLGHGLLPVLVGIGVGGAAGQKDGLAGVDEVGGGAGRGVERHLDGMAAGFFDGLGVDRPGTEIVVGVGAGGQRNGDAGLHRAEVRVLGFAVMCLV